MWLLSFIPNALEHISEGVSALLGGAIGWLLTRKKQAADLKGTELDNVEDAVKIWRELAEGFESRFKLLESEVKALREENESLRKQVTELHIENVNLKNLIT